MHPQTHERFVPRPALRGGRPHFVPRPALRGGRLHVLRDRRGQIMIEYLVVVFIVGLGLVLIAGPVVGPRIVSEYARRTALLYSTYP